MLPPPISPPLLLSSVFVCPLGSRGGVSEEDAGFRAQCCRRMALRIQGKDAPLFSIMTHVNEMECSPGGRIWKIRGCNNCDEGECEVQVGACHHFNISNLLLQKLNQRMHARTAAI